MDARKVILVVDDEAQVTGLLRIVLEPKYEVWEAKTGSEALADAYKDKPSLILLDLNLGKSFVTGLDALRMLKATPTLKDIPVVVLSGYLSPENKTKVTKLGAAVAIEKPYSPAMLLKVIGDLLAGEAGNG